MVFCSTVFFKHVQGLVARNHLFVVKYNLSSQENNVPNVISFFYVHFKRPPDVLFHKGMILSVSELALLLSYLIKRTVGCQGVTESQSRVPGTCHVVTFHCD